MEVWRIGISIYDWTGTVHIHRHEIRQLDAFENSDGSMDLTFAIYYFSNYKNNHRNRKEKIIYSNDHEEILSYFARLS